MGARGIRITLTGGFRQCASASAFASRLRVLGQFPAVI